MSELLGNHTELEPGHLVDRAIANASAAKVTQLELAISVVLRVGVALSLGLTIVGLILLFTLDPINAVVRRTGPFYFHDPATILGDLLLFKPKAMIDAGLILLILTPVFRVLVTVIAFVLDRDRFYSAITLFVLAVLIASFFLGRVE